jgi:hypothetical protein
MYQLYNAIIHLWLIIDDLKPLRISIIRSGAHSHRDEVREAEKMITITDLTRSAVHVLSVRVKNFPLHLLQTAVWYGFRRNEVNGKIAYPK